MIDPDNDEQIEFVAQYLQHHFYAKAEEIRPSYIAARTALIAIRDYLEQYKDV